MNTKSDRPRYKVSCVMVTLGRIPFCKRAIRCFANQSYPNKELVVIDDSGNNLSPLFSPLSSEDVHYVRLSPDSSYTLGELRNIGLEESSGRYIAQWDDDDWYHPERLNTQIEVLEKGYDACCLRSTLMHVHSKKLLNKPFLGSLRHGVPGTIVHRGDPAVSYPNLRRGEDSVFLNEWQSHRYTIVSPKYAYLFVRCYHGSNTWSKVHFKRRMRNNIISLAKYIWHKYIYGDIFSHPCFRICQKSRQSFKMFIRDSVDFGLIEEDSLQCV